MSIIFLERRFAGINSQKNINASWFKIYFLKYIVDLIPPKCQSINHSLRVSKSLAFIVYQIDTMAGLGFLFSGSSRIELELTSDITIRSNCILKGTYRSGHWREFRSPIDIESKIELHRLVLIQVISYKSSVDCWSLSMPWEALRPSLIVTTKSSIPERSPSSIHTVLTISNSSQFSRK